MLIFIFHLIEFELFPRSPDGPSQPSNVTATTFSPVVLKGPGGGGGGGGRFGAGAVVAATAAFNTNHQQTTADLGRLDGLVSSPNRGSRVRVTDSKKIAAILLETNIVELQRHLLTITVQNQVNFNFFFYLLKIKIYKIVL